jgi:hypothetical protein
MMSDYEEVLLQFTAVKKKMFYVDTETKMGHPLTRKSVESKWTCHNRDCNVHITCKAPCNMGCDE